MNNIIGKHVDNVQKKLKKYSILTLKSRYDKAISEELIQTYIDARYYNYGTNKNIKFFYRRIYDALRRKGESLIKEEPRKKELIDNTVSFFQYYFYFDFVRNTNDLEALIKSMAEKRINKLNLRIPEDDTFEKDMLELVKKDIQDVKTLLVSYNTKDFSTEINRVSKDENYYRVNLKYYFDFPAIFSEQAIHEVFTTDLIAEDKLFVEYPLIAIETLKDVLNGDFDKIYICDFATSLFSKKNKKNQIFEVVNNEIAQDKIFFEVNYQDFLKNKEGIFDMMREGYRFVLKTDYLMPKLSSSDLKLLEVFACVIADSNDVNIKKYKNVKLLKY